MDHDDRTDDNHDTTLLQPEFFTVCALEGIMVEGAERDIMCKIGKEWVRGSMRMQCW